MQIILTSENYTIVTAMSELELVSQLTLHSPDLILLDILISGSDGREICRKLKSNDTTKHIPIVMISAHPSAKRESQEAGADGFLAKPFEIDDLLETVKSHILS
jgi:CheY-like chemotaxis protein